MGVRVGYLTSLAHKVLQVGPTEWFGDDSFLDDSILITVRTFKRVMLAGGDIQ